MELKQVGFHKSLGDTVNLYTNLANDGRSRIYSMRAAVIRSNWP